MYKMSTNMLLWPDHRYMKDELLNSLIQNFNWRILQDTESPLDVKCYRSKDAWKFVDVLRLLYERKLQMMKTRIRQNTGICEVTFEEFKLNATFFGRDKIPVVDPLVWSKFYNLKLPLIWLKTTYGICGEFSERNDFFSSLWTRFQRNIQMH